MKWGPPLEYTGKVVSVISHDTDMHSENSGSNSQEMLAVSGDFLDSKEPKIPAKDFIIFI